MDAEKSHISQHTSQRYNLELENVLNKVMTMGGLVEKQVGDGVRALLEANSELGELVSTADYRVNRLEVEIDEENVIKVNWCARSLERIGDHAKNVREYVIYMVKGKNVRHTSLDRMQELST